MYDAVIPHPGRVSGPLRWRTLAVIGAALVIAACGSDGVTPTAPTPKTASVTSVAVTGSALAVGATVQFIATATLSDGSTQNVTTGATWASSNPNVASVTSAGVVNAQTAGTRISRRPITVCLGKRTCRSCGRPPPSLSSAAPSRMVSREASCPTSRCSSSTAAVPARP